MNVLHWHIVDSYSFPYQCPSYPDLALHGSWHPAKAVYSQEDVESIVT
jgi:hypothetical protein